MADSRDKVPDTATTYERAKPANESPGGKLSNPPPRKDQHPDVLRDDAAPAKQPSKPKPT